MNDNPRFVKETLLNIVRSMDNDKSRFVRNPEKDFTRRRTLISRQFDKIYHAYLFAYAV